VAIQTNDPQVSVGDIKFAARYEGSYRIMDSIGQLISSVHENRPEWTAIKTTSQQVVFRHHKESLVADIGNISMALHSPGDFRLPDASAAIESFALASEYFYELVTSIVKSKRTDRVGVHFGFGFPSGSVEEADRFVVRALESPFSNLVTQIAHGEFVDGGANFFVAHSGSPLRRSFALHSTVRNQKPGAPPLDGFPITEGEGAVILAIDNFTRADSGHFPKVRMFVQNCYAESKSIALEVMQTRVRS